MRGCGAPAATAWLVKGRGGRARGRAYCCCAPDAAKPRFTATFSRGLCATAASFCCCSASRAAMDIMPAKKGQERGRETASVRPRARVRGVGSGGAGVQADARR